jgi:DNA repair exonuclease SbcCD ATPase subunit
MSDSAAPEHPDEEGWPAQGIRARIGSRLERHVMRSAVDMLDERGTELDGFDRDLQRRERELHDRFAQAEAQESDLEHRERRLAELGAEDLTGQPRIDHLIRQLDRTEEALGQIRAQARHEIATAHEQAHELKAQLRRLEEEEHRRLLTQADLTRRESTVSSHERELRMEDDALRRREQELEARQQGLLAHERRLAEREGSLERRARELEEREDRLRAPERGWWPSSD